MPNVTMNKPIELGTEDFGAIKAALEFYLLYHKPGQPHVARTEQLRDKMEAAYSMWLDMDEGN